MKNIASTLLLLFMSSASAQVPTRFTYQGRLTENSSPANGSYDLRFAVYDAPTDGSALAGPLTNAPVIVSNGLFTVLLDFGATVFTGGDRWLEMAVRTNGSSGAFTTLSPRQPITSSPYAIHAASVNSVSAVNITGTISDAQLPANIARLDVSNTAMQATGAPTVTSGFIIGARVTGGGSGYTTAPTVTVIDTTGSGAAITATVSNGMVASLTVANAGSGYSSGATLTIEPPPSNAYQVFASTNYFTGINTMTNPANAFVGTFTGNGSGLNGLNVRWSEILNVPPVDASQLANDAVTSTKLANDPASLAKITGNTMQKVGSSIGIGTSSPVGALDVAGRVRATDIQLTNGAGSGRMLVSDFSGVASWTDLIHLSGGNVGIGLGAGAAPRGRLHVAAGPSGFSPTFTRSMVIEDDGILTLALRVSASAAHDILFERPVHTPQAPQDGARINASNGELRIGRYRFSDTGSASTAFFLFLNLTNGNFGIKRAPVTNDLEVDGTASKLFAGDWLANSDARIKTGVRPVAGALERLAQVRLVSFRYTDEYRSQHPRLEEREYLNVIAQEFQKVFPEHVKSSGEKLPNGEEILQVDTHPLTIYSAAAVQELHQLVKQKEAKISNLEKRLAKLEALVSSLAAKTQPTSE